MRNGTFKKKCLPIVKKKYPHNYYYTPFKEIKNWNYKKKKSMKKKLVYMENTICLLVEQNTIEFFKKL